jgi:hypothetical protein
MAIDIGRVVMLSDGLISGVLTGNLGEIVGGLAMPTVYDDGSPRYPFQAFVKIWGGASVFIGILKGGGNIFLTVTGGARFTSINNDGWVHLSFSLFHYKKKIYI